MATFEYIFCGVLIVGSSVLIAIAMLAGAAVLIKIAIDFIKGD